jgi:hypothetical protein
MIDPTSRRGFLARVAQAAALVSAGPSAILSRADLAPGADQRPLTLQYYRGEDMEHGESLARNTDVDALREIAQRHAGGALSWGMGETEGCVAFAMHPSRDAEYLLMEEA